MPDKPIPQIPFLDEETVKPHLRFEELIPAMADALRAYSSGSVQKPDRQMLPVEPRSGHILKPHTNDQLGL